jgi:hypothetical protein
MKTLRLFTITITAFILVLSCKDKPITPEMKLTKVYVESGNLDAAGTTFTSSGAFKAPDKAVGSIDSTCSNSNGYTDTKKNIYVFEGGAVPKKIAKLSAYTLYQCFTEAKWTDSGIYNLPNDAQICVNFPLIYFRLKGNYPRQVATIKGEKVYRFQNNYFIENYTPFSDYHLQIRTTTNSIDLIKAYNLSSKNYIIESSRPDLIIDPLTGIIDFSRSKNTPLKTMDKITIKSNNNGQSYRLRSLYITHNATILRQFFRNGTVINKTEWNTYLIKTLLPQYNESIIEGYKCTSCTAPTPKRELDSPPEPIINNG